MKIIKPSVKEIKNGIPGKKMEYCGRICYKSDSNINDESYVKFLKNIKKSGHCSVLESERVCFEVDSSYNLSSLILNLKHFYITSNGIKNYISANVRAWLENINGENLFYPYLQELYPFIFEEECKMKKTSTINFVSEDYLNKMDKDTKKDIEINHIARTFVITGSRAFSHQIVRHRVFSFSQQSQRYCNFSNDKFGHSIDFIMPIIDDKKEFSSDEKEYIYDTYIKMFQEAEDNYFFLIKTGVRPEDARAVLLNATATIIAVTGTVREWDEFFKLRCDEHAQREIRDIANLIKGEIYR